MEHKTSKINLARKLKEIKEWLKTTCKHVRLKDWWQILKAKLRGHYNYFGISGNYRWINKFYWLVRRLAFKWVTRRSQKKSMTWEQFVHYIKVNPLPEPKIYFSLHISCTISLAFSPISPIGTGYRYFVIHTICAIVHGVTTFSIILHTLPFLPS